MTSTTLIKNKVLYFICALIKDPAFAAAVLDNLEEDRDRKLGTHSMRKFAAKFAKICGCSNKDKIDY